MEAPGLGNAKTIPDHLNRFVKMVWSQRSQVSAADPRKWLVQELRISEPPPKLRVTLGHKHA